MSIIHIPFYPSDWLAGTVGPSDAEKGWGMRLIALQQLFVPYSINEAARSISPKMSGPNRNASVKGDAHGC